MPAARIPWSASGRSLGRARVVGFLLAATLLLVPAACSDDDAGQPSTTAASSGDDATEATSTTAATAAADGTTDPRELLAPLLIDDGPHTTDDYDRGAWHLWDDIDGDGCDARHQALRAASVVPAEVDEPCAVVAGEWVSAYDGFATTNPGDLDVDHVVPLADAHISGGWTWTAEQRRQYANDQENLWVVSASSNRSKRSSAPDRWRPANQTAWCEYAQRWTGIKVRWALTATTSERDALGQMLDTCPAGTVLSLTPTRTGTPPAPVPTTVAPPPPAGDEVFYANCAAARSAGAAPIHRGDPGYRAALDRNGDGIACE